MLLTGNGHFYALFMLNCINHYVDKDKSGSVFFKMFEEFHCSA